MTPEQMKTAEKRVLARYKRLHKDLIALVSALYKTEPTGNWLEKVTFKTKENGRIQLSYKARPTELIIDDGERIFKLKLEELRRR